MYMSWMQRSEDFTAVWEEQDKVPSLPWLSTYLTA